MIETRYEVLCDNQRIATDMTLQDALIFVEAYFNKYCQEHRMVLSIKEMERTERNIEDS